MNKNSRIYIAGARGMVGSAIYRRLAKEGYSNILTDYEDLRVQDNVNSLFNTIKPEYVFIAAAKVGGIKANNTKRAEFIYDNLAIQTNVINAAYCNNVKKLLFIGSSCIYPKNSPQPIKEEYLLTGELEQTNEPYAVAKIAGIKMCQAYRDQYGCNYICAMPTNSYGLNDNYNPESSHVMAALISRINNAFIKDKKSIEVWGTGNPRREFIYVDDMADGLVFLMKNYNEREVVNIGTGEDISIRDLTSLICKLRGWDGEVIYNGNLDGTMLKRLDVSKINSLGWKSTTSLEEGINKTFSFIANNY